MTEHLPECPKARPKLITVNCICPSLRACEQRVLAEREADGPWFRSIVHQCCEDKQTAYTAGLDAAQDAVAAISGHSTWPDMSYNDGLIDALAAIDALRDVSND